MKLKNVGYNAHRLHKDLGNEREIIFAKAWDEHLKYSTSALANILGKENYSQLTDEDIKISATIIQWLGSNCGVWFLRDILMENKNIHDLVTDSKTKTNKDLIASILDKSTKLCYKIESSGCSKELTECSILAADLRHNIEQLTKE